MSSQPFQGGVLPLLLCHFPWSKATHQELQESGSHQDSRACVEKMRLHGFLFPLHVVVASANGLGAQRLPGVE
jgi:hypothetical protein